MWRVFTPDWKSVSSLSLFLGKTGSVPPTARCSGNYDVKVYLNMYKDLTGKDVKSESLDALVDIALEEWLERLNQCFHSRQRSPKEQGSVPARTDQKPSFL